MERQNGWYLKSNGYMSPNDSYQKIGPMKACTALDNGNHVTFVKVMDGTPVSTVWYVPMYYIGALKAENEKLRELCASMWDAALHPETFGDGSYLLRRMRELGIEVPHGRE